MECEKIKRCRNSTESCKNLDSFNQSFLCFERKAENSVDAYVKKRAKQAEKKKKLKKSLTKK